MTKRNRGNWEAIEKRGERLLKLSYSRGGGERRSGEKKGRKPERWCLRFGRLSETERRIGGV